MTSNKLTRKEAQQQTLKLRIERNKRLDDLCEAYAKERKRIEDEYTSQIDEVWNVVSTPELPQNLTLDDAI